MIESASGGIINEHAIWRIASPDNVVHVGGANSNWVPSMLTPQNMEIDSAISFRVTTKFARKMFPNLEIL